MVDIAKPPEVGVPSARTPGQFVSPERDIGQAGVALGRTVQSLARPLLGVSEMIAQVQDAGEIADVQALIEQRDQDMKVHIGANKDYSTYQPLREKFDKEIKTAIEKNTTRRRTQDALENYWKVQRPIHWSGVTKSIQDGIVIDTTVKVDRVADLIVVADYRERARVATAAARRAAIKKGVSEEDAQNIVVTEAEAKISAIMAGYIEANITRDEADKITAEQGIWDNEQLDNFRRLRTKQIYDYERTRHLAEESEVVYEAINAKDYELADELVGKADIPEKDKTDLHNKINSSRQQNEQRLEDKEQDLQTENQAKITSDIYAGEIDASVIDANINAALLPDEEGVRGLTVSMAKSLKGLNKREDVVTSDESNIDIDTLIRTVRSGEKTYDEAIEEYTTKIAKGVNPREGAKNLDDIRTAADSAKDPVLSKPSIVRGHQALDRVRATAIRLLGTDPDVKDVVDIEDKILRRANALDDWAVKNKDDTNFTERFQNEVKRQLTPIADEITLGFFERMWGKWVQSPFGVGYRKIAGIEKEEEGLPEPTTVKEFEDNVRLLDDEEARAYYEKWKDKW